MIKSKELRKCVYPGCEDLEDPRWGGFCDAHGEDPLDNRNVAVLHLREQLSKAPSKELFEEAISLLLNQVCLHEETEKQGFIWTYCHMCDRRWETHKGPGETWVEKFLKRNKLL